MLFRTPIDIEPQNLMLRHNSRIAMIGSCFTDNIGSRLSQSLFRVTANPCGTVYNPESILRQISIALGKCPMQPLFFNGGQWHSLDFHSSLSSAVKENAETLMERGLLKLGKALTEADLLVVTLGTAWVYSSANTGITAANCHKLPKTQFHRHRMNVDEVENALRSILSIVHEVNPNVKTIFTVSPMRHVADTLAGNSVSKSVLRVAVENVVESSSLAFYFPAYEIMVDDLRDYRFYASDMVHPSEVAADYICDCFLNTYCSDSERAKADECLRFTRLCRHRPLTDNSDDIQALHDTIIKRYKALTEKYPYIDDCAETLLQDI